MNNKDNLKNFAKNLSIEKRENILSRNSSGGTPKLLITDFHKQDPSNFLVLPKRRADTNSVYSFGLKYAFNQEKQIVNDLKNDNYFKFDYNILRNRLANDPILRETLVKRILLNKNLKKKFTLLDKPFPLLNKISNCKAINKTENFLLSMILNHKFDINEDLLYDLLNIRKNKNLNREENEKLNMFLSNYSKDFISKKEKSKVNLINLKNQKDKETETFGENDFRDEIQNQTDGFFLRKNKIKFNVNDLKENKITDENKSDFFLISSNFDKLKTFNKRNNRKKKSNEEDINLSFKLEQKLLKSLAFDNNKFRYDRGIDLQNQEEKENENNQKLDSNLSNNLLNISKINQNSSTTRNNENDITIKNKTIFMTRSLSKNKKNSQKSLINLNLHFNEKGNINLFNRNNKENNNIDESLVKTKLSMKNFSTFHSNSLIKNISMKKLFEKDETKSKIQESSQNLTELNIFNKYCNKTVSTENDFRNININAINNILNTKRNSFKESKQYFVKPDFMKYKYPEENNKPIDSEYEKIKSYVIRKNKSSQIKSRIYGQNIDLNILEKFKNNNEISNINQNRDFFFILENNLKNPQLLNKNYSKTYLNYKNTSNHQNHIISNIDKISEGINLSNKTDKKTNSIIKIN